GEGGDRHPVEQALGVVGDLAGLVQLHQAVGEHLAVDAVPAAGALGQFGGHHVGDGPDADLQGGAVGDVSAGLGGDGVVDLVGRSLGQGEGLCVVLDHHVDQVEGQGV